MKAIKCNRIIDNVDSETVEQNKGQNYKPA